MADDEFGVKMIYPTNSHPNRAKPWLLGKGFWEARRFDGWGDWDNCPFENGVIEFTNHGSLFHPTPGKGRLPVLALLHEQYPQEGTKIVSETNQSKLRKRGFMGTINDWKNVEVTAYFKLIEATSLSSYLQFTVRGGPHHSEGDPCDGGVGLCASLNANGEVIIDKEYQHPKTAEGKFRTPGPLISDPGWDDWIGMKSVVYTKANGNPYIEFYLDKDNNNDWKRVGFGLDNNGNEITGIEDVGDWWTIEDQHNGCGGDDNEKITWGGPGVIFKIQGITVLDLKKMSVREILPPEGWPLRYLLNTRGVSPPFSMRNLAQEYGLTAPVSLRQLTELEAERYPFP